MNKHFEDCPTNRKYETCTCEMCGEEIALVEWCIQDQEGKLPWWNIFVKLMISGHPPVL